MKLHPIPRRQFLSGAAAFAALWRGIPSFAMQIEAGRQPGLMRGPDGAWRLSIDSHPFNVNGRTGSGIAVNGSIPGPLLRFREGEDVVVHVDNRLDEITSIHWHGFIIPPDMDGVPGVSFGGIPAKSTFTYRIPVRQSGTYWAHSHSGGQEFRGLYLPIIIDPAEPEPFQYDRDFVVMLSDWSFDSPEKVLSKLKKEAGYYNFHKRTVGTFISNVQQNGMGPTVKDRLSWSKMRMDPTDFADVTGFTESYLLNGLPSSTAWTGLFQPGERVRLRIIDGAAMTLFDFKIPGLKMTVVLADGQYVDPVDVDVLRIAPGETYDVLLEPKDQAYTVYAAALDRSGFVHGTLAPQIGLTAAVPALGKPPIRTMSDMGMDMSCMEDTTGMAGMAGMTADAKQELNRATSGLPPGDKETAMANMPGKTSVPSAGKQTSMTDMPGMGTEEAQKRSAAALKQRTQSAGQAGMSTTGGEMHGMKMANKTKQSADQVRQQSMRGMKMANMKDTTGMRIDVPGLGLQGASLPGSAHFMHDNKTHGSGNSMVAMVECNRLDDPGSGFTEADGKVLTYADLRSPHPWPDLREPTREVELHVTGNMDRYMWSFDGKKYSDAPEPIHFAHGERLRLILVNDTMMEHPIHLHGMWMYLENGAGAHQPRKHTIIVKPAERVSLAITADAVGRWAFHCHLLLHMEMGMFRVVEVSPEQAI